MPKEMLYEVFQTAMTQARLDKNLTQQEVADRLGRPQSFVSKYESGERRLDVVEFLAVCRAMRVNPLVVLEKLGVARK